MFAGVALCLTSTAAQASEPRDSLKTGNDLLVACGSEKPLEYGMCMGYIAGVIDGFLISNRTIICLPSDLTRGQLRDVVLSGIQDAPRERGDAGYVGVLLALSKAFPCLKRGGGRR